MYSPVLSIIIPTRNRQKYAEACVRSIFALNKEGFQIIVQDNSDDDNLSEALNDIESDKLIYHYSDGEISFCDNFSMGLEQATGDYVIYIGDDDGILPEIFDIVDYARNNNIEAIRYFEEVTYQWPGAVNASDNGKLVVRSAKPYVKNLDTSDAVETMVSHGDYNYLKYHFPTVYHGIVQREAIDRMRKQTGHYFGGLTPDIYAAVALSFHIKNVLYINYPFSIPGVCPRSGSADSLTGKHNGDIRNAPHFRGTHEYQWDQRIPYVYSVDTIWAETAYKAMTDHDFDPKPTQENYYKYLTTLVMNNPGAKDEYLRFYINRYGGKLEVLSKKFDLSVKSRRLKMQYKRGMNYLKTVCMGRYAHDNITDIQNAIKITEDHLKEKGAFSKIKSQLGIE